MPTGDADDPEREARLTALRTRFRTTLGDRVAAILDQLEAVRVGPWPRAGSAECLAMVHGLAGSAGLFGQDRLGEAAAAIEKLLVGFAKRQTTTAVDIAALREAARRLQTAYADIPDAV